ncbi:MAG: hypothetical protein J2P22_18345 [Nocardioides sp.]|nr:hypothetical protein [Nocardioides sp.]
MPDDRRPARSLYLHVGLQKTGTSYLQGAMLASRTALAEQGVDLVPPTKRRSYDVMLAVRGRYASDRDPDADRATLRGFSQQLADAPGPRAVYSQEMLAGANPDQIARLLEACGDREIHVVLTVRDLARQIPSSWQQSLQAGRSIGFRAYLRRLQAMEQSGSSDTPWINLDAVRVIEGWSAAAPPDRVHVVTVPPSGSPSRLLLERFCEVLDVDPSRVHPDDTPGNPSLGRVQAEVLRRVNAELPDDVRRHDVYGNVGKRFFAVQVLRPQERRTILVPSRFRPWCEAVTERQVATLEQGGYRVVGSLADLRCRDEAFAEKDVVPSEGEIAAASVTALADIIARRGRAEAKRRTGRIAARSRAWEHLRRVYRRFAR